MIDMQENLSPSITGEPTNTSLSLIKNASPVKDIKSTFTELRKKQGYSVDGIWSDSRLETATRGIGVYVDVYNGASEQLKKYLDKHAVIQAFTGVRPVVQVGTQDPKTLIVNSSFYDDGVRDSLFPTIYEEFQKLLKQHGQEEIRLERVDFRKVEYINNFRYELMNASAIQNVANENPDLFPTGENITPIDWLIQNPYRWSMTPHSGSSDNEARLEEVRSGVVSGFPRQAADMYSEESTSGIDWGKSFKNMLKRHTGDSIARRIEHQPFDNQEVRQAKSESTLWYVHYTDADLKWTQDAAALLKHSRELFGLPQIKEGVK